MLYLHADLADVKAGIQRATNEPMGVNVSKTEHLSASLTNAGLEVHNRDEIRRCAIDTLNAALVTFPVGSSWLQDSQPIRGTKSSPIPHVGYMISGAMGVRMNDDTDTVFEEGEIFLLPPGHDAWPEHNAPLHLRRIHSRT